MGQVGGGGVFDGLGETHEHIGGGEIDGAEEGGRIGVGQHGQDQVLRLRVEPVRDLAVEVGREPVADIGLHE